MVKRKRSEKKIMFGLAFGLLISLGLLSGSRRFFVTALLFLPLVLSFFVFSSRISKAQFGYLLCYTSISLLFILSISHFVDFTVFVPKGNSLIFIASELDSHFSTRYSHLNAYPIEHTYRTLIDYEQSFGLSARLERWNMALSLINLKVVISGNGFDYLNIFGCHFAGCAYSDYPHNPALSALLSSGALGLISCIALYAVTCFFGIRLLVYSRKFSEWGAVMLMVIPYTLISGNTLFSMPVFFIVAIICYAAYQAEFSDLNFGQKRRLIKFKESSSVNPE